MGEPGASDSRLLAAAADQIVQALRRQQLAAAAAEAEIAKRSDRVKSALLDSVSHDLRTPLATILAAAGTLSDPEIVVPREQQVVLGTAIETEVRRLDRLVRNLLDMSRIEGGALRPAVEVVPLLPIVESVLERLQPILRRHRVEVEVPDDLPPAAADPLMLDQVLTNLLENAARYVPPEGTVRVRALREGQEVLAVVVEDDGPGVAGNLDLIFDKFHRYARQDGDRRGTGLGLAVVRGLVEAMGGKVHGAPSELGGLAIEIRLPAGRGDPSAPPLNAGFPALP